MSKSAVPIVKQILNHAKESPDKLAIISGEKRITYAELANNIGAFTKYLIPSGVAQGDRIVLCANSDVEFIYAYFGCHLLGAIAVPLDASTPTARLKEIARKIDPKLSIWTNADVVTEEIANSGSSSERLVEILGTLDPSMPADILFTSGTTGEPKGVVLSHANLFAAAISINSFIGNSDKDTEILVMPQSFVRSCSITMYFVRWWDTDIDRWPYPAKEIF